MIKKMMATAAAAASVVGIGAAMAPQAMAIGNDNINVLSNPQNQQCTENSTQAKGDEALSHILDNIPILSGNGAVHS
ncbi:hypothetical protein [Streptomyces katrae]|uniref:hypothetical protein n=1 Tax=Streptomyces katrae TaxID=68223 RepID=UPI0004C16AC0|nr:hypothetical protein [Streptomyces katrae]